MGINRKLLPVKAHFFFGLAAAAPVFPFVPLMIKELGFSATVVGVINTIVPVMSMVAKPWAGIVADKFKIHKYLLVALIVSSACSVMLIRYVPALPMDSRVALVCGEESTELLIDTSRASDQCFMTTLTSTINRSTIECEFVAKEWQGGLIHALERNPSDVNASALTEESIFVTLGPPRKKEPNLISIKVVDLSIGGNVWNDPTCFNSSELTGDLVSQIPMLHEIVTKSIVQNADVVDYSSFWMLLAVVLGFRVLGSCIENLADSVCFKLLEENPHDYGLQRMWGAAGWGLMSFMTGLLVDWMSEGKPTTDRSIAFYLSIAMFLVDALVCLQFKVKNVNSKKNEHIFSNVRSLMLNNPRFLVFLVLVVGCGVFSSMVWNFLFWLIEEIAKEEGCSNTSMIQTLNGLVLAVNCYLGEIPFFFLSGWILRKIGYEHCMTIVLIAFGVRFISYYFLTNPWWILPIEILNGVSFGLFYATMTTYANALTPPGLEGTMQGLVSAAFEGIGLSIGSFIGGYLFDHIGGRTLFLFGGAASLFLAAAHSVLLLCWMAPSDSSPSDQDSDDYAVQGLRIPHEQNHLSELEEEWED